MPRLARLLLGAALVASFALTGLGVGAGPASATALPIGQCTTTSGVVLAVDFSYWGGPLLRSCGTTPTAGFTLLNQGGWASAGTVHDGPAFVCRIGYSGYSGGTQYPTSATEACNHTPPATKYWSYWHANPGDSSWSYSQLGATKYQPKPGSVDLWVYGQTSVDGTSGSAVPTFSPDSVRAHNTSPVGVSGPPVGHSSVPPAPNPSTPAGQGGSPVTRSGTSTGAGSDTGMSHGPAGTASTHSSATSTPTSKASASKAATSASSSSPGASPIASSPGAGPKILDAEPAAATKHSSGSFAPVLIGGLLVAAIGGIAGVTGWRRRRAG